MRKVTVTLMIAFAMLTSLAAPASAEKPPQIQASGTFLDVNACTGELETLTLDWTITVHQNQRNTVLTFDTVIETSSGFFGTGTETQIVTAGQLLGTLNIRIARGDQVVMAKGHRQIDLETGEMVMTNFRTNCVRD